MIVRLLARPAAIRGVHLARPFGIPLTLAFSGRIEQSTSLFDAQFGRFGPAGHEMDRAARDHPLDIVAGLDAEAIGDRLGDRDLQLAGNSGLSLLE